MFRRVLILGVVVLVSPGTASGLPRPWVALAAAQAPRVTEHRITRRDRVLRYRVHWPARSDAPAPLVVGFHGRTRSPPRAPFHMLDVGRHDPFGEAVVVAPLIDWDAPWVDTQALILRAVREVARRRSIDSSRVAVAGFSMGASSALYLARNRPRIFSSVLAATGRFPERALDDLAQTRTRVLLSWSGAPRRCRETVRLARRLAERGGDARAVVFEGGRHEAHLEMLADPDLWRWWIGEPPAPLD